MRMQAVRTAYARIRSFPATPHIAVLVVGILLLGVFFWRVTLEQRVLSPADIAFGSFPWKGVAPEDFKGPVNPYQSDDAFLGYPRRSALYNGPEPGAWQDEYLTGTRSTYSVDFLGLEYYAPAWAYRILPFPAANSIFHMSVLLVAGASMYVLLRQLRLPWLASVYGGVLFMFNGHFIVWLGAASLPAILGLVPLMIFGFERAREKRQPLYLLIPTVCFALQIYIAYVPGWVVTGLVLALYGVARAIPVLASRSYAGLARDVASYAGSAAVGLLLSAYALLPTIDITAASSYQRERASGLGHYPLEQAWTFLFPDFFGGARNWFGFAGNYPEWVAYAGVSAAPLAVLGLWRMRRHWLAWFSLALIAFSASQVYGIPPLKEFAQLPGLKQVAAGRWLFGLNLALAMVAPAGLAELLDPSNGQRVRRILAAAVGAVAVLALVAVAALYLERRSTENWMWITEGRHLVPRPWDLVSEVRTASTEFHRQLGLLMTACALTVAALLLPATARVAACGLVVLAFIDIFAFGQDYNATVPRSQLYPETPGIEFLKQDDALFRIAPVSSDGLAWVLPGFTPNLYGLSTITGYDHFRSPDYLDFIAPLRSQRDVEMSDLYGYVMVGTDRQTLNENLLAILNVKYVVASPGGLYFLTGGQSRNETPFPVYGTRTAGQLLALDQGTDSVEVLLATGGGPAPDAPITLTAKRSRHASDDLSSVTLQGKDVRDNQWYVLALPDDFEGDTIYVEVGSPEASEGWPYYVWGTRDSQASGRFEAGSPVDGALALRALANPGSWLTPVYAGSDLKIYQVESALPRAWGVGVAEVVESDAKAMVRVASEDFDPATEVVFAGGAADGAAPATAGGDFATEIVRYESDRITVQTDFASPGYLVVSTRFDGGWEAEIDGRDAEVLRADGVLMALSIEAGQHMATLKFEPQEYVWGRRITMASAGLTIMFVASYLAYRRRRGNQNAGTGG